MCKVIIRAENVSKLYTSTSEAFWALRDVNFEILQGDTVNISGNNGAGKSTLLKILSRITAPTQGRITGFGRINSLLEAGAGFHPELTGLENIYLNGAMLKMNKTEISKKIDEICEFAGANSHINIPVKKYSTGMYMRLAFSVALHLDCEIMILDEVLAVGDYSFQQECLKKIKHTNVNEGRTILMVSHDTRFSRNFNKQIKLINGRIAL